MKVTFDTNCIIDIELNEGAAADLLPLLALHEAARLDIRVSGIVASERLREGGYSPTFASFAERVQRLSSRLIKVLKPLGHWDVTFWDEGLWADDEMVELEAKISAILFPEQPYEWAANARAAGIDTSTVPSEDVVVWRRWRNRLCDTAALWCHIYYSGDMFVTSDGNFLKAEKKAPLEALGAKRIRHPHDARVELGA